MKALSPNVESGFRPDIQGLRALAVLMVVAFHARLPFPGGFSGVDVFFVISGFVIMARVLREHAKSGSVSIPSFYRQRFFRLTPALAAMVSVTLAFGAVILFPDQQLIALETGIGAMLLVANVVIARTTGGYFDSPAASNPLLNTWSLSVEEQFYLIFPMLTVALLAYSTKRRRRSLLVAAIALVSAGSLLLATYGSLRAPGSSQWTWLNFYSPAGRIWEFGVGALLAVYQTRGRSAHRWLGQTMTGMGLVGITGSALFMSESLAWPGPWTIVPVAASCLVILGGALNSMSIGSRLLSLGPFIAVGNWSYSIYLWHWPFISFAIYLGVTEASQLAVVALLSFIPAYLSYKLLERPLRRLQPARRVSTVVIAAVVVGTPLVVAVVLLTAFKPVVLHEGELGPAYLSFIEDRTTPCEGALGAATAARCRQSLAGQSPTTVVVGDSHAEHLYPGLLTVAPGSPTAYAYLPEWPLLPDTAGGSVFQAIAEDPSVRNVILGSRWTPELLGEEELATRIDQLTAAGKTVFLANDGPFFSFHARECKYARPLFRQACSENSNGFFADLAAYSKKLQVLTESEASVHILDTATPWCQAGLCSMVHEGVVMYADNGHLNVLGSTFLMRTLVRDDPKLRHALGISTGN